MSWFTNHLGIVFSQAGTHLFLAVVPVVIGLIISIPLGWLASRYRVARAILIPLGGILYTIPSLVLLVVLPLILKTQLLDEINLIVALTIYTCALLIRSIADSLASVPDNVVAAANAIGYRSFGRFIGIELPLAVPVMFAGLRVATVSNISLVSVGALVGIGGLGQLLTAGFQIYNTPEVVTAVVAIVVLALILDGLLVLLGRALSPWAKAARAGATA
ncbi:MAG TPA: ABC transporter permease subunit [Pseudonocardiaceae bacterium]|nr:ABC transporter permease subunit [Pseudonocardiaceae bacterium]